MKMDYKPIDVAGKLALGFLKNPLIQCLEYLFYFLDLFHFQVDAGGEGGTLKLPFPGGAGGLLSIALGAYGHQGRIEGTWFIKVLFPSLERKELGGKLQRAV